MAAPHEKVWKSPWFLGALIIAATVLAYLPALRGGFIWDDDAYVTHNRLLTAPDGLARIWFSFKSPSQYFPLTYTILRVDRALWGLNPFGYHLVNVLLHAVNALLVWALLVRLKVPGAWLAAAIFALHPVQVESVAWITERKNVLMCFFFLLSLLAWVRFVGFSEKRGWLFYLLALCAYCLALFAKTTACTLPAASLLILWLQKKSIDWQRIVQIIPFVLLGIAMGLVSMWWERFHSGTAGPEFTFGPLERLLIASHALWFYAGKLFWPAKLTFIYPKWVTDPANPLLYGWIAAILAVCALIYLARRVFGRAPEVGVIFFVATLGPVLGPIMLYTFRYTFVADHYQYVASIGLIALFAASSVTFFGKSGMGRKVFALVIALLLVLGALTWRQTQIYRDRETLWRDTVAKNPQSWLAHLNLGVELKEKGENDAAKSEYDEAFRLNPDSSETLNVLGVWEIEHGRIDDGIEKFRVSLRIYPNYAFASFNLGNALSEKSQLDEAVAAYKDAIRVDPGYVDAHANLAVALSREGKLDEAIVHYKEALRLNPDDAGTHNNFGAVLTDQKRFDDALQQFRESIRLKPGSAKTHINMSRALLELGRKADAVSELKEALRLRPDSAEATQMLRELGATTD
jgi:Tfp pilus assembly protein PilF